LRDKYLRDKIRISEENGSIQFDTISIFITIQIFENGRSLNHGEIISSVYNNKKINDTMIGRNKRTLSLYRFYFDYSQLIKRKDPSSYLMTNVWSYLVGIPGLLSVCSEDFERK
jgi:hypothetical protein